MSDESTKHQGAAPTATRPARADKYKLKPITFRLPPDIAAGLDDLARHGVARCSGDAIRRLLMGDSWLLKVRKLQRESGDMTQSGFRAACRELGRRSAAKRLAMMQQRADSAKAQAAAREERKRQQRIQGEREDDQPAGEGSAT